MHMIIYIYKNMNAAFIHTQVNIIKKWNDMVDQRAIFS
jgi:hypothetical protein